MADPAPREAIGSRYEEASLSPGLVLWQVATVWQRAIRTALAPVDLTHAQFVLLASTAWLEAEAAGRGGSVTQAQVAAQARTDPVMTSEVLRTLEKKGYLQRLPHPTDARARRLTVTDAGRDLARRAVALVEAADEAFFGAPGDELRALARVLCARFPGESAPR